MSRLAARLVGLSLALGTGATAMAVGARAVSPQGPVPAAARPVTANTLLAAARQLVVVTTADWNSVAGTLRTFELRQPEGAWAPAGPASATGVAIVVGKRGTAWDPGVVGAVPGPVKAEGDGRSPAGVFALGTAFGFAPATEVRWLRLPYREVTPALECVDDPRSRAYNTLAERGATDATWTTGEKMREVSPEYHWGVVVEYNTRPVVPGRGSCIFLHVGGSGGGGTAGCTAMAESSLKGVMRWLDPAAAPVLVQMPREAYETLRAAWRLPALPATR